MATTKKKVAKKPKAKPSGPKESRSNQTQVIEQLRRERDEAREQLAAASHILHVIARSSTDIRTVLDGVAENAARLCAADDAQILRVEGDVLTRAASYGSHQTAETRPIAREIAAGRAVIDRQTVHVQDIRAAEDEGFRHGAAFGYGESRTLLAVPLLRESIAIGVILIRRFQVRPFSDNQIALLKTFADQAVIAIENVRLFQELKESLEQQTGTSKILSVIASSPTDIQPVLNTIAENAAFLCGANDALIYRVAGSLMKRVAHYGPVPMAEGMEIREITPKSVNGHAIIERQTIHIHDLLEARTRERYPESARLQELVGHRTTLVAPLMREGVALGSIVIRRMEVHPFSVKQIALLETFADQAVIAIENVRLFKELQARNAELREALEHQTATSEVLGIISRSPADVQPVLDAIVESAARVCGIDDVVLRLREGNTIVARAHFGPIPMPRNEVSIDAPEYYWVREHGTLHVPDLREHRNDFPGLGSIIGFLTFLAAPLFQQDELIGSLNARRIEVRPFTPVQIKLLETFADQAVIAIENVRLFNELQSRNRDLIEALEQQTATSEILSVIAGSPTDLQPVLNAVAESAARLCDATDAVIYRTDNDVYRPTASYGPVPVGESDQPRPIDRGYIPARAMIDRQTVHIHDLAAESAADLPAPFARSHGVRTALATPLLREGIPIGAIFIRRLEVRPFTDKQIKLLETFADQAVIAIENVRLFKELQERNAELREALEHQTATAEVLGIISRSPTDVQPVLDAIVESAGRVCGIDDVLLRLRDGNTMVSRAHFGRISQGPVEINIDAAPVRWVREHGTLHIPDIRAQNEIQLLDPGPLRTFLIVSLRQQEEVIGALVARRMEVRPFTPAQIKLLETFADQAVIAIENVRLFQELKESLEQQTATSEILGVIASSPTDIQPVLNTIAENATRVCGASDSSVFMLIGGDLLRKVAGFGTAPGSPVGFEAPLNRDSVSGRAVVDRETLHIHDFQAVAADYSAGRSSRYGHRTLLMMPLLREGVALGVIGIRRMEVKPFTDKQIALLKTFADQAVIAIENVRLFNELKESLEQQTATSEILGVIASSPTDVQPVLDVVAENAARLCDAKNSVIFRLDGDVLRPSAIYGPVPVPPSEIPINGGMPVCRAVIERQAIHVHDVQVEIRSRLLALQQSFPTRTLLAVPLLREGVSVGSIAILRTEVRPFTDRQIKLLETFAAQAVIAIENVRLFQELEARTSELTRSVGELRALGEVGQAVSSTLDLETVLTRIASHAVQLSGADGGAIYEYDEATQEFQLRGSHQIEKDLVEALRASPIQLGGGAVGQAAASRQPVQVTDVLDDRQYAAARFRPMLARLGYRSLLAVPLLREQRIMGGITIYRRSTGSFSPEVINLLQTFATQSVLAIQNARLFREIEDKSRQIEAANRHKSEFLANMSHELRTPLNAIIGFSEVLQERLFGELNEKQAEYTDDILSSGRHLLSLINEILDLSKVEAGRMELELSTFDLPTALENARTFVRERAVRRAITLDLSVDERLGDFIGDERKIKQILLNLLSNAVKFTPEGGRIEMKAMQVDGAVEISVSDTGIGIASEDQATIFEEFRQVGGDYTHKKEGTGLGLTLAKKFVELHGGVIRVESDVGKGSTFAFTLPMSAAAEVKGSTV